MNNNWNDLNRLCELYNSEQNNKKLTICYNGDLFIGLVLSRRDIFPISEDFTTFISRETHLALERIGYNFEDGEFKGLTHDKYVKMRDHTLKAVINKLYDLCEYNPCSRIALDYKLDTYYEPALSEKFKSS